MLEKWYVNHSPKAMPQEKRNKGDDDQAQRLGGWSITSIHTSWHLGKTYASIQRTLNDPWSLRR